MFLDVCDAVAYAHRNLIVHLDLKPSNILGHRTVSSSCLISNLQAHPDRQPADHDRHGYARLRQSRAIALRAVTTACDIYALGAVLFDFLPAVSFCELFSGYHDRARYYRTTAGKSLARVRVAGAPHRGVAEGRLRQLRVAI